MGHKAKSITVTGVGEVQSSPDIAILNIGVEALGPTVAEARATGADAAQRLLASLLANGVQERDIQTAFVGVQPNYEYPPNGSPRLTGYTTNNQLTITVRALDSVAKVIDDGLMAAGDTARMHGLQFSLADPELMLLEARTKAIADAKSRATTYATAAGMKVGRVQGISEAVPPQFGGSPKGMMASRLMAESSTPIQPGETKTSVTVVVQFALKR